MRSTAEMDGERALRVALPLVVAVVAWPLLTTSERIGDPAVLLPPLVILGGLACLAGWLGSRSAAVAAWLGGIIGAAAVVWAAGPVGVLPGEDPAMRYAYHSMLIMVGAGTAAVFGTFAVVGGYLLGRLMGRLFESAHR